MTREMIEKELESEVIAELPDRAEMSLINANVAAPINLALAANVLSDNATAQALAAQSNYIPQGI
ncbi:MAG: hypothetical protein E6I12_09930 [Chloroflexi bacterium]|nr:MAG: hypothetical protein E6I12_09930 [Chloroflexota bacterium]